MIDKLTVSQEALLKEYRDKVFGYATSTVTDKPKAEAAVLRLTKGVLVEPEIHWACSPKEAEELFCSLRDSLWDSLRGSLRGSLWGSLWGSGLVVYFRFSEISGMVKYEETVSMHLRCYEELNESCFAMYALPGHIILLEKPKRVNVEDGKLIEIGW